jgi:HlyD family secretion protein
LRTKHIPEIVLRIASYLGTFVSCAACAGSNGDMFSGTVQAPSAAVGSPVAGRVTAVLAQDGQRLRAGQVLVRFDDVQLRAELENARHAAAAAGAALADLRAGARAPDLARANDQARQARETFENANLSQSRQAAILRAVLAAARAQYADAVTAAKEAHTDAIRARSLFASGDSSGQQRDTADTLEQRTRAQVNAAEAAVQNAQAQLEQATRVTLPRTAAAARAAYDAAQNAYRSIAAGSRPDAIRQAAASLAATESSVARARARLSDTIVRAPADGVVSALDLHVGDLVAPGSAVATIDEDGEPFVRIYVPQSILGRVRVGERVAVQPDSQPAVSLGGTVEAVDAQAQFTPQSVQTADDRATLSFGVKVRIHDREHRVFGGTTATVRVS